MADRVIEGQIILLSRLLKVEPERLAHLERLGAENIADIRVRLSDVVFDELGHIFRRFAALTPTTPLRVILRFAHKRVPPRLAGRAISVVALDHPRRTAQMFKIVDPHYAARVAPHIDPRAVTKVAALSDRDPLISVAREVLRRRDYVTAADLIMAAPDIITAAAMAGELDDVEALKAGSYALTTDLINDVARHILGELPEARRARHRCARRR